MLWFFAIVTLMAAAAAALLLGQQIKMIRANGSAAPLEPPRLIEFFGAKFDGFYFAAARFARGLLHELYIFSLVTIHLLLVLFKLGLSRLEHRFSRLVNAVKGRSFIRKKGAISVFLMNLKKEK